MSGAKHKLDLETVKQSSDVFFYKNRCARLERDLQRIAIELEGIRLRGTLNGFPDMQAATLLPLISDLAGHINRKELVPAAQAKVEIQLSPVARVSFLRRVVRYARRRVRELL